MQIKYTTMKASVILAAINNQTCHVIPAYVINSDYVFYAIFCLILHAKLISGPT